MVDVSCLAQSASEARVLPGIYSVPGPSSPLSSKVHEPHTKANEGGSRPLVSSARYLPWIKLSVFKKISLNLDSPIGLYFRLNLSNRWKESWCACMSRVSIERSYALRPSEANTSARVRFFPSRKMTISYCVVRRGTRIEGKRQTSGVRFIFDLMNRSRCFWFILLEWWTWVSTFLTL